MIKAKVTKIDGDVIHLRTEHNDEVFAARYTIDFGVLEGDSIFLKTESGEYKFRRLEKDEAQDGEPHYYDADWKKREDEHLVFIGKQELAVESYIKEEDKKKNSVMYAILIFSGILITGIMLYFSEW